MLKAHITPMIHILRRAAAMVMLLPFLALCLLSPAAMLERGTSGKMMLVLCTGDGPVEMAVNLGSGAPQTKQRCDWAAAHAAMVDGAPFALASGAATFQRAAPALATVDWHPRL